MRVSLIAALVLAQSLVAAEPGMLAGPPRLDLLHDAAISRDGSGGWLLTGTIATLGRDGEASSDYNRGAPLWQSGDLKNWQGGAYAWDRVVHFAITWKQPWADWGVPGERLDGHLGQATTTPSLHQIDDTWYLLCAMNHKNVFLLKSTSGKPAGPYTDHGYFATRGGYPSLFTDDDGSHYLLLADGWLARITPDLHDLAEPIKPLLPATASPRLTLGDRGCALFKRDGHYQLLAPRWQLRDGAPSHDAVLWTAASIAGPYTETQVVLAGTGPVTVFQDEAGDWQAVASSRSTASGPRIVSIPVAK